MDMSITTRSLKCLTILPPVTCTTLPLSESSWTVVVVTASVKEDERGGQGHISTSLLHQSTT
jgi:hypothetical protein